MEFVLPRAKNANKRVTKMAEPNMTEFLLCRLNDCLVGTELLMRSLLKSVFRDGQRF